MELIALVSNEVPEVPSVSPLSGAIFEKRVIEKYIRQNGVDPVTGQELHLDDLIEIKTPPIEKPKPPSATLIPATLKNMQDKSQRQQLQTTRQGKDKKSKKMLKMDARILGFSVTAS